MNYPIRKVDEFIPSVTPEVLGEQKKLSNSAYTNHAQKKNKASLAGQKQANTEQNQLNQQQNQQNFIEGHEDNELYIQGHKICSQNLEWKKEEFLNEEKLHEQEQLPLFEQIGGAEAVSLVVDKFYEFILADSRLNHYFQNTDMEKQRKRQKQFITMALGGPNEYQGVDMKKAHCKHAIGMDAFLATWQNLQKALKFYDVKEQHIEAIKQVVLSTQEDIVNKK